MRLIVVDSITNPFRELDTTDTEDSALRSLLLYQIASTLKEAAHRRVQCARLGVGYLLTWHLLTGFSWRLCW